MREYKENRRLIKNRQLNTNTSLRSVNIDWISGLIVLAVSFVCSFDFKALFLLTIAVFFFRFPLKFSYFHFSSILICFLIQLCPSATSNHQRNSSKIDWKWKKKHSLTRYRFNSLVEQIRTHFFNFDWCSINHLSDLILSRFWIFRIFMVNGCVCMRFRLNICFDSLFSLLICTISTFFYVCYCSSILFFFFLFILLWFLYILLYFVSLECIWNNQLLFVYVSHVSQHFRFVNSRRFFSATRQRLEKKEFNTQTRLSRECETIILFS